jgi:hypothetical protein
VRAADASLLFEQVLAGRYRLLLEHAPEPALEHVQVKAAVDLHRWECNRAERRAVAQAVKARTPPALARPHAQPGDHRRWREVHAVVQVRIEVRVCVRVRHDRLPCERMT